MFTVFDNHLTSDDGGVIAFAFNNKATAAMREVVDILWMTSRQIFVVDDIDVSMPTFAQLTAFFQADNGCRFAGNAMYRFRQE